MIWEPLGDNHPPPSAIGATEKLTALQSPMIKRRDERPADIGYHFKRALCVVQARLVVEPESDCTLPCRIAVSLIVVTGISGDHGKPAVKSGRQSCAYATDCISEIAVRPTAALEEKPAVPIFWKSHSESDRVDLAVGTFPLIRLDDHLAMGGHRRCTPERTAGRRRDSVRRSMSHCRCDDDIMTGLGPQNRR